MRRLVARRLRLWRLKLRSGKRLIFSLLLVLLPLIFRRLPSLGRQCYTFAVFVTLFLAFISSVCLSQFNALYIYYIHECIRLTYDPAIFFFFNSIDREILTLLSLSFIRLKWFCNSLSLSVSLSLFSMSCLSLYTQPGTHARTHAPPHLPPTHTHYILCTFRQE